MAACAADFGAHSGVQARHANLNRSCLNMSGSMAVLKRIPCVRQASAVMIHSVSLLSGKRQMNQPRMPFSNLSIRLTRLNARHIKKPNTPDPVKSMPPSPACPFIASWDPTLISVPAPTALIVASCTMHCCCLLDLSAPCSPHSHL